MIVGCCIMAAGAGLLTTLQLSTPEANWIGYQVLYGWGLGNTFQAPNLAAQTVLPLKDVPIGTSLMFFSQLLGGAVFISVGQNVLNNQLLQRLSSLPGFNPSFITNNGATTLTQLPESIKGIVLVAYNESLRKVFQVGLIMACLTIFGALALEWKSVKKNKKKAQEAAEEGKAKGDGKESEGEEEAEKEKKTAQPAAEGDCEKKKDVPEVDAGTTLEAEPQAALSEKEETKP